MKDFTNFLKKYGFISNLNKKYYQMSINCLNLTPINQTVHYASRYDLKKIANYNTRVLQISVEQPFNL